MKIFELNCRTWQSFEKISDVHLTDLVELGFDTLWLMGVWQISEASKRVSRVFRKDFDGSPYAVPNYSLNPLLGGEPGFLDLKKRANKRGLRILVDFVSNHTALDSPWISENPDHFILSNPDVRPQSAAEFFLHPCGQMVAFGRDPYFPPWTDTAQLDYSNPALRQRMVERLIRISQLADGVRCDMAMLVLKNHIKTHWFPMASETWFDTRMPGEFWDEAISKVKVLRPDFAFLAEVYWDKEEELLRLGFDGVYEKRLYDGLVARNPDLVEARLRRPDDVLKRSVVFIENHDEARAAAVFTTEENLAASALICSLPGSILIHQGQIEGFQERLPVQLLKATHEEPVNTRVLDGYKRILKLSKDPVLAGGDFVMLSGVLHGGVSFLRRLGDRQIVYLGLIDGEARWSPEGLELARLISILKPSQQVTLRNLFTWVATSLPEDDQSLAESWRLLTAVQCDRFCLLEICHSPTNSKSDIS